MGNKETTLEESFEALECILKELDKENVSLEESFDLYTKGMELVKICNSKIELVEKKLRVIGEENGDKDGI